MVQDYFLTPTAIEADLVLPASFPAETGGSFTNSQKVIQEFDAVLPSKMEMNSVEQLSALLKLFGFDGLDFPKFVLTEIVSLLPQKNDHSRLKLKHTQKDDLNRIFDYGCDSVVKRFEEDFENAFVMAGTDIVDEVQDLLNDSN